VDAAAIAAIYNQGIADRIATFETEPRSAGQIAERFSGRRLVIVAETENAEPVAFAASFPYSDRLLSRQPTGFLAHHSSFWANTARRRPTLSGRASGPARPP
jgi:L-amino acid N-acyltransferase YncA